MKKVLVACVDYPNNDGGVALMYVHVRNMYYIQHGIDVTVLNFSTHKDYMIDKIKVICLSTYKKTRRNNYYDELILHAANLRNHYLFLKKYKNDFRHFIFFYHGHEILKINKAYPKPYSYERNSKLKVDFQNFYDKIKLSVWHYYLPKIAPVSDFIFVSQWLYAQFKKYVRLNAESLCNNIHVINNSVGQEFEEKSYKIESKKQYDFITIRNNMDNSKYCIDLVDQLARKYSNYNFLVIGKGNFYKVHKIPENVTWIDSYLSHEQIIEYIDISRGGLMLTREDTQGVMTCELAVYGIPVITSDIAVCHEMFDSLNNVKLVKNDVSKINLDDIDKWLKTIPKHEKIEEFSYKNTVRLEENIIKKEIF